MNVKDMLHYGHLTFKGAYENIPEDKWDVGEVTGHWSVKNIVAHLTSYEWVVGDVLTQMIGEGETPHFDKMMASSNYNDGAVEERSGMSPAETRAEYEQAHTRLMELVPQVPAETYRQNGTIPWYGEDYCLNDFVVYINYAHKREHAAEINLFRDRIS